MFSILLPFGYLENLNRIFPMCYRAPGLNERYNTVRNLANNKNISSYWLSKISPQITDIILDSQEPCVDIYLGKLGNNGPCRKTLTKELAHEIEKQGTDGVKVADITYTAEIEKPILILLIKLIAE